MNKEITMEFVVGIVADFLNAVNEGEQFAYENAVHTFKNSTELNDEQEAMLRNSLYHLEIMENNIPNVETMKHIVGCECNVILWTLAADWHCINTRTLGDSDEYLVQTSQPNAS